MVGWGSPDLDAAKHVAIRVGQRLALLLRNEGCNLVLVLAQQVLKLEEDALACDGGGLAPGVKRLAGAGRGRGR
jgi:hypothetical protein